MTLYCLGEMWRLPSPLTPTHTPGMRRREARKIYSNTPKKSLLGLEIQEKR